MEPDRPQVESSPDLAQLAQQREPAGDVALSHWEQPGSPIEAKRRWTKKRVAVIVLLAALLGAPLAATAFIDATGQSGSGYVQAISFGTGGSGCSLATAGSSFRYNTPIRVAAEFIPALQPPSTVTIKVWQDGTERPDLGSTIVVDTPADCVSGNVNAFVAGHYRLEMTPSQETPISGEFDVTP